MSKMRNVLVTGGSRRIGAAIVRMLAADGWRVIVHYNRSAEAAEQLATEIVAAGGACQPIQADLSQQDQIAGLIGRCVATHGRLDCLINNASSFFHDDIRTVTWDSLNELLTPNLIAPVLFGDMHFRFLAYDPLIAYGQSKSACALMAVEATRRWAADGILANALNPGAIATNLQKHTGGLKTPPERQKNTAQGAATSVLLAASPLLAGIGGRYFEDCNEAPIVHQRPADYRGVAAHALDPVLAERLWNDTLKLTA